jgi:hypothetical protein
MGLSFRAGEGKFRSAWGILILTLGVYYPDTMDSLGPAAPDQAVLGRNPRLRRRFSFFWIEIWPPMNSISFAGLLIMAGLSLFLGRVW